MSSWHALTFFLCRPPAPGTLRSMLLLHPSVVPPICVQGRHRHSVRALATAAAEPMSTPRAAKSRQHTTDFVVIGSGIGGLSCAALLARYGFGVTVCESHYAPGGAAHGFTVKGHHFDSGPSFFAGLSGAAAGEGVSSNPLKQVLDAVEERVDCAVYDRWITYTPEGTFPVVSDSKQYAAMIQQQGGDQALQQWRQLEDKLRPLQQGAALFPAAALREDLGVVLTMARFGPKLALTGLQAPKLTAPFAKVVDPVVTNPWLRSFLDLECFVLSGMLAKDTICAEMAFMLMERNSGQSTIDYPMGGSASIVNALIRGIEKHGGQVLTRAHVDNIHMEDRRAAGVVLQGRGRASSSSSNGASQQPEIIHARRGVISNASVWDTLKLLPEHAAPQEWTQECSRTPQTGSFMHLHLGIDASGLPSDLECHHLVVNQWHDLEAPQNVCIISIPSVFDKSLAPPGKHTIHAYVAANEPYDIWKGLDRKSQEYQDLKEKRCQPLWEALERVIPDIRKRAEVVLTGSPLTHEFWLRRDRGTYGAAISAQNGSFPGSGTPVKGLYRCGDSTQPGIGVPAAAASGLICANTLAPVRSHLKMLQQLKM